MPVVVGTLQEDAASAPPGAATAIGRRRHEPARAECLEIGILNNMPDQALVATERQFVDLLGAAAGKMLVRLRFFSLPEVPRGDAAKAHVQTAYGDAGELVARPLDGLIVTGNEPHAARLPDEPYWESFTNVIDWAEHNTTSTIFSCLAAHAAVLHLDGVTRHPLDAKRCGVFDCAKVSDSPLLAGVPAPLRITHSRWNDLKEAELAAHGYRVLTRSAQAGVDMFMKRWRSLFVFFQGHPEYERDSLMREYRRDVSRFVRGEREVYPDLPQGYFDPRSEEALAIFGARARSARDPALLSVFPDDLALRPSLAGKWGASATPLLRNWLAHLAAHQR
ncbi:MAG: homoserine O-succinyltransferase [Methylobacteriaceae bacterium]|nr:homoserine O-succinyltransferase [Methylobacteriaceae bacterium]